MNEKIIKVLFEKGIRNGESINDLLHKGWAKSGELTERELITYGRTIKKQIRFENIKERARQLNESSKKISFRMPLWIHENLMNFKMKSHWSTPSAIINAAVKSYVMEMCKLDAFTWVSEEEYKEARGD